MNTRERRVGKADLRVCGRGGQTSQTHVDEALLNFYIREWNRYTTAAKFINDLFRYLNRHWVRREKDEGKKDIYDVYTVSYSCDFL